MNHAMNHATLLKLLLPPVAYDPSGAVLTASIEAEGAALDRAHTLASYVLEAISPAGAGGLWLADWERVLGLPDGCAGGLSQTMAERIAAAMSKMRERGGQSRAYFIGVAAALGYAVTIEEHDAFTCETPCDQPLHDEDWRYAWTVRAPETTIREFSCDSCCTDPLASWGNALLECVINRLKPAHTHVIYSYGG
ncbi:MAG: DUF2313 domain-containing protein [Proteobacteria bacterium]|nr:DUF2313 domain-containing protein [Pseudomonadota bacterium]